MEELSDIKRDFNIDKMCRTCLQETEDEMHEIFGSIQQESDAMNLNQVLLQLTGNIQVNKENGLKIWQHYKVSLLKSKLYGGEN